MNSNTLQSPVLEPGSPELTVKMQPDIKELSFWLDAVSARVYERQTEAQASAPRARRQRADSKLVALAIQDVQRQLTDPEDGSGLREDLPLMAQRADSMPHSFTRVEDDWMPADALKTFAIPLIRTANQRLRDNNLSPNIGLENASRRHRPSWFARALAHITMARTRDLLFTTVLDSTE